MITAGTVGIAASLLLHAILPLKGMLLLSSAFIVFGTGEVINHPAGRFFIPRTKESPGYYIYQRRRNSCSLGNLLDIGGLLLFFLALSALLF